MGRSYDARAAPHRQAVIATVGVIGGAAGAFASPTVAPLVTGTVAAQAPQRADAATGVAHSEPDRRGGRAWRWRPRGWR
ncbi:hypothetical protein GCM10017752_26080 [Streptomyces roseoviridis]